MNSRLHVLAIPIMTKVLVAWALVAPIQTTWSGINVGTILCGIGINNPANTSTVKSLSLKRSKPR